MGHDLQLVYLGNHTNADQLAIGDHNQKLRQYDHGTDHDFDFGSCRVPVAGESQMR